jgi:hypothetical protein
MVTVMKTYSSADLLSEVNGYTVVLPAAGIVAAVVDGVA